MYPTVVISRGNALQSHYLGEWLSLNLTIPTMNNIKTTDHLIFTRRLRTRSPLFWWLLLAHFYSLSSGRSKPNKSTEFTVSMYVYTSCFPKKEVTCSILNVTCFCTSFAGSLHLLHFEVTLQNPMCTIGGRDFETRNPPIF